MSTITPISHSNQISTDNNPSTSAERVQSLIKQISKPDFPSPTLEIDEPSSESSCYGQYWEKYGIKIVDLLAVSIVGIAGVAFVAAASMEESSFLDQCRLIGLASICSAGYLAVRTYTLSTVSRFKEYNKHNLFALTCGSIPQNDLPKDLVNRYSRVGSSPLHYLGEKKKALDAFIKKFSGKRQELKMLLHFQKVLGEAYHNYSGFIGVAGKIQTQITQLSAESPRVWIPGGVKDHFVIYEVEKSKGENTPFSSGNSPQDDPVRVLEPEFTFRIYNKGSGVSLKKLHGDKRYIRQDSGHMIVRTCVTIDKLRVEHLSDEFWQELINHYNAKESTMMDVYNTIHTHLLSEGRGKIAEAEPHEFHSPQQHGTCAVSNSQISTRSLLSPSLHYQFKAFEIVYLINRIGGEKVLKSEDPHLLERSLVKIDKLRKKSLEERC